MKYQTAKFADGMFNITCPHCSMKWRWTKRSSGRSTPKWVGATCPIGNCGQEIHFPNAEEAEALKPAEPLRRRGTNSTGASSGTHCGGSGTAATIQSRRQAHSAAD